MADFMIQALRRVLELCWLGGIVALLLVVGASHIAPHVDAEMIVIRGRSMEPTIPIGSALVIEHAGARQIEIGDVVTYRLGAGTLVTHRVVGVLTTDGISSFQTKGDANPDPDPQLVAASAVVGTAQIHVPVAGYILYLLSRPAGIFTVISFLLSLMLAVRLLEEIESIAADNEDAAGSPAGAGLRVSDAATP